MSLSNNIIGVLNVITFLLSFPLIASGTWLATKLDTECVRFVEWPVILIGLVVLFISVAGFVGAFWKIDWLLGIYLVFMFLVILALLGFIIFAFIVTKKGPIPQEGSAYHTYKPSQYSAWLHNLVQNNQKWGHIRSCLRGSKFCNRMSNRFNTNHLSLLQASCCIPPSVCGYQYVEPTYWINPRNAGADEDCMKWSNNQSQLCYDCDSCKGGLLANTKEKWRKVAILGLAIMIALMLVYVIGCCAFYNARTEQLFKRYARSVL